MSVDPHSASARHAIDFAIETKLIYTAVATYKTTAPQANNCGS
jgi:hypothetical protein